MQVSLMKHAFMNADDAECELLQIYVEPCL